MILKTLAKIIMYGSKRSSETYIKYLKKNGCEIGEGVFFYSPQTTTIDDVRMNWISIGAYTKITQGVTILAHDYAPSVLINTHNQVLLAGGAYTKIGCNCFIGMNAVILPGRTIGNNCIIGAGSVVSQDIPDNSICAGNPAEVIMILNEYHEKRQKAYAADAKRNVQHFIKVHGRPPRTEELHGFAMLFLERTKENWERYYTGYLSHDNNAEDVKQAFFNTRPVFTGYDAFIAFCNKKEEC